MAHQHRVLVTLALPCALLVGCPTGVEDGFTNRVDNNAAVQGSICTPSGTESVAGATVAVYADTDEDGVPDDDSVLASTTTALDGTFTIEGLSAGEYVGVATRGHHQGTFPISYVGESGVRLDAACLEPDTARIALVGGSCDDIADRMDTLDFVYETIDVGGSAWAELLTTSALLSSYDILIAGCGMPDTWGGQAPTVSNVINGFLAAGGSLYVSGDAWPVIEAVDADLVDFFREDDDPDAVNVGVGQTVDATVVAADLQPWFTSGTAEVLFDDDHPMIEAVGTDAEVLLTGTVRSADFTTVEDAPLAVHAAGSGGGTILYSSFGLMSESDADVEVLLDELFLSL